MSLTKTAEEILASKNVGLVNDFAIERNRLAAEASRDVEVCKLFLRLVGQRIAYREDELEAEIRSTLGTTLVVIPPSKPCFRSGTEAETVEASLPAEIFSALFVKRVIVTVEPVSDFEKKLQAMDLTPRTRALLANLVEMVPQQPKVILPK